MERLTQYYANLKTLRSHVVSLIADAGSLAGLFAEEANRLNREEQASRLVALRAFILRQLEQEREQEISRSSADSTVRLTTSLIRLGLGAAIKAASKDKQLAAFSDHLLNKTPGEKPAFGNVLVCIGLKGIPGDVGVVSVSRLARESNQEESQVIGEIKQRGYLLLSKEAFSFLMDTLIKDVWEGQVLLPISLEKLQHFRHKGEAPQPKLSPL